MADIEFKNDLKVNKITIDNLNGRIIESGYYKEYTRAIVDSNNVITKEDYYDGLSSTYGGTAVLIKSIEYNYDECYL